jgi:hypothetical protein
MKYLFIKRQKVIAENEVNFIIFEKKLTMVKYFGKTLVLAAIVVMSSCGDSSNNQEVNEEVQVMEEVSFELPKMTGQEYKIITDDLIAKGLDVMNNETGEAKFDVYCFGEQSVVEDCMSHFSETIGGETLVVENVVIDGVDLQYAYRIKK